MLYIVKVFSPVYPLGDSVINDAIWRVSKNVMQLTQCTRGISRGSYTYNHKEQTIEVTTVYQNEETANAFIQLIKIFYPTWTIKKYKKKDKT